MMIRQINISLALAAAVLAGSLGISTAATEAGEVSSQQIRDQLKASKTRSLSGTRAAMSPEDLATIKRVSRTRSLSAGDRDQIAAIAAKRPTIDLEINFDYNSATLSPRAEPQLKSLGDALTSSDLKNSIVMLAGHTDAKGGDDYNQSLSERRAEAVKSYLIERYRIQPDNLVAVGYGEKQLKTSADPLAAENRRVQIVNMAEHDEAAK
ncbi:OmpA family protein [Rhodopseudomonas palustris]|uniref:OmpA family protein n=1 Tax=Rhodopseudomonas palustris TaxID=1076 RepID=UPI002ACED830|nr:OmpA family protein [Rhodopseudomonas palustris]WQG98186.1 OmpA family protein [Rhodopseudomonas palustris]